MRNFKPFLLTTLGLTLTINVIAQEDPVNFNPQLPPVLPKAPNTAALSKFGDYQVNLFSGVPSISIPLYTIKTGGFEVPISLVYHASGIKLHDDPSWVGAGWALDAGGEITRRVVGGKPDESAVGFFSGYPKKAEDITGVISDFDYLNNIKNGYRDMGADIFSYSFPGGSGKFFFDRDNSYAPVLLPYAPVKVICPQVGTLSPLTFDMLDGSGNHYEFGKTYTEVSSSSSTGDEIGGLIDAVSAWMLEKMISPDKTDTITFSYKTQGEISQIQRSDTWVVEDKVNYFNGGDLPQPYFPSYHVGTTFSSTIFSSCNQKEIKFKTGRVVFDTATSAREDFGGASSKALQGIRIYSNTSSGEVLIESIKFYQSYFTDGNSSSKRLRLDSIQVLDAGSTVINTYRFEYNTTVNLPAIDETTVSEDYWGYYNGRANSSLVPQTAIDYIPNDGNLVGEDTIIIGSTNPIGREPDPVSMQAEILKRIYYPTGGHTDFDFETNQYLDTNSHKIKFAGGLRVKSIKNYDGITPIPVTKFYKYGSEESGYGRPNFLLTDYSFFSLQHVEFWDAYLAPGAPGPKGAPSEVGCEQRRTYFSNPAIDLQSEDGVPVAYEWVTEYAGNDSAVLGKTVYHFKDIPDDIYYLEGSYGGYNAYKGYALTHYYERGQPLSKKYYKRLSSGGFQPVQEETYLYNDTSFHRKVYFGGLIFNQQIVRNKGTGYNDNLSDDHYYLSDYDFYYSNSYIATDDNYMTAKSTITYDPNDSTKYAQTLTTIAYGNFIHQQPTTITTTNSKNETEVVSMKYPGDFGATYTGSPILDSMLAKNMQTAPIEKWLTINKSSGNLVLKGNVNTYKQLSNGLIVPDQQKELFSAGGLSSYAPTYISSGTLQTDSHYQPVIYYDDYDSYGNFVQLHKANDTKLSYIWDYNSAYPVAQVTNADSASIAYTSFEADGKGNWSFSGAASSDATSPTGKNCYNLSGGSITKSGLTSNTYIVSYWGKSGSASVNSGSPTRTGRSAGSWTYYEHEITGTSITISGSVYIDEVRLYPKTAQMITSTFKPLVGMTSQCDANNRITYYEYDNINRLSLVRDQDHNILKKMDYNYVRAPEDTGIYFSAEVRALYTKNNCGGDSAASVETYLVPEYAYSSPISQEAADALAENEAEMYGQAYANIHGACTADPGIAITCYNNTGLSGYTATYTNLGGTYNFSIPAASGAHVLGYLPPGRYTLSISSGDNSSYIQFYIGESVYYEGFSFFGFATVNSTNNTITMDPY